MDSARGGFYPWCKPCQRDDQKRRHRERREADPLYVRRESLRRRYGLTLEQYDTMLEEQEGLCPCGRDAERSTHGVLAVDHDHDTGIVRGLTCTRCNRVIGMVGDDPAVLRALADYLERARV
jgi:hypothetical protein